MARKASPQVENGYIRIANELFVALMQSKFTASERRCIDLVLRLSYGCGKKSAQFRFWSDFEVASILKQNVKSVVRDLEGKGIFKVDWETKEISLNKNYLKWDIEMANLTRKMDKLLAINLQKSNPHITFQDNEESKSNPHITQKVIPTLPKSNPHITSTASKATDSKGSEPPKDSKDSYKEEEAQKWRDRRDRILPNGMTAGDFQQIGNMIKIGAFEQTRFSSNAEWLDYIKTQPKENIEKVAKLDYVKAADTRYVIERMYDELKKLESEAAKKPERIPAPLLSTEQLLARGEAADYYTREDAGRSTPKDNMA